MPKYKPITEKSTDIEKEQLTMELIKWLSKRNLFSDVCIYVNNKRYKSDCYQKDNNLKEINDSKICPNTFYVEDNINVKQYIEYASEKLITMSKMLREVSQTLLLIKVIGAVKAVRMLAIVLLPQENILKHRGISLFCVRLQVWAHGFHFHIDEW